MRITSITMATVLLFGAASICQAGELSGDEIKALISGKTVSVTHNKSGKQWRTYFAADGSTASDDTDQAGEWFVKDGMLCNTGRKLKCAKVGDNGDGTYSRIKPDDGTKAVTWTKIEDGKTF